ncbi:hypothetical protein Cni_G07310 [Canna indica]|uniref:Bowman-Birk serine protease inhibitors family domain-containing protein n=1 Tax=Canna indica TaxID=4628 RepID=A0AAQ3JYJ2_9LILI|nr:hypothetical protein Cni_G07310 [Canna indica]
MKAGTALIIAALLAFVSFSAARMDASIFLPSQGRVGRPDSGKPWECCDMCLCTRSNPPQCQCMDMLVDSCHSNCKKCACTMSIPAQCRCFDIINELCGDRCTPES